MIKIKNFLKGRKYLNKEIIFYILCAILGMVLFGYLFYNSIWIIIPALPLLYPYSKWIKKRIERKKSFELNLQFKDALLALTAALHAGYSVENAIREAYQEMETLYGKESEIAKEFKEMLRQMGIGRNVEDAFEDFANRSLLEDVTNFAQIFRIAKRSSGGISLSMDSTAETISEKIDVQREIRTLIQAKRFEQMVMNGIPIFIILYMRIGNGEFMSVLYTSLIGKGLMTGCLVIYIAAMFLAEKIVDIKI